jgi:hypothetical protein
MLAWLPSFNGSDAPHDVNASHMAVHPFRAIERVLRKSVLARSCLVRRRSSTNPSRIGTRLVFRICRWYTFATVLPSHARASPCRFVRCRVCFESMVLLADVFLGICIQRKHRELEHSEGFGHVFCMQLPIACMRTELRSFEHGLMPCARLACASLVLNEDVVPLGSNTADFRACTHA